MAPQQRGTIIKVPDSTPGLLFVNGQQKPFTLERIWNLPVAPMVNMAVNVEFDAADSIARLTAVDAQHEATVKLEQMGGMAKDGGIEVVAIARKWINVLAARMGKVGLGAAVVLWIAWFFMPTVTILQDFVVSRALTFWEFLALSLSNELVPLHFVAVSHGLLSIIGLAAIAAPFAAPFVRHPRAKFLYAMPLLFLILAGMDVSYEASHAINEAVDNVKRNVTYVQGNPAWNQKQAAALSGVEDQVEQAFLKTFSIDYGFFVVVIASLVLAVQVRKHPAFETAGSVARSPTAGFVS